MSFKVIVHFESRINLRNRLFIDLTILRSNNLFNFLQTGRFEFFDKFLSQCMLCRSDLRLNFSFVLKFNFVNCFEMRQSVPFDFSGRILEYCEIKTNVKIQWRSQPKCAIKLGSLCFSLDRQTSYICPKFPLVFRAHLATLGNRREWLSTFPV